MRRATEGPDDPSEAALLPSVRRKRVHAYQVRWTAGGDDLQRTLEALLRYQYLAEMLGQAAAQVYKQLETATPRERGLLHAQTQQFHHAAEQLGLSYLEVLTALRQRRPVLGRKGQVVEPGWLDARATAEQLAVPTREVAEALGPSSVGTALTQAWEDLAADRAIVIDLPEPAEAEPKPAER